MGIIIRQSIFTSIISYAGVVIGYINLLYLYPKFLELEQVGLLRTIQDAAMLLSPFAQFGLGQSIVRFYPKFSKNDDRGHSFINMMLLLSVLAYGAFLIVFFTFQGQILSAFEENAGAILNYINLVLWLTFFLLIISILEFYSRALLLIPFPNFLREIGIRLLQGILVSIFFLGYITFHQFLIYSVVLYAIVLLILIIYLVRHGQHTFKSNFSLMPVGKLAEILRYASFSFVGASSMILIGKLDSLMVTSMLGLTANAIYTTAFYMASVIDVPKRAITQAAATVISRAFENKEIREIRNIYRKTALNQFIIGTLLLLGVWANIDSIFELIPKGNFYQAGMYVVVIVGAGKLVDMLFGPNGEVIVMSKYYWFNNIVVLALAIMVITANYFLIPLYGVNGAAYGTGLALVIFNLVKFGFVYLKLHIQPFGLSTLKVLAIGILVAFLNLVLPKLDNVLLDIFYRSFIITASYGSMILWTKSSADVNRLFRKGLIWLGVLSEK